MKNHSEKHRTVHLAGPEAMYLRNAAFLPDELARVVDAAKDSECDGIKISLSRETSERFREIFTERLAKVGFDDAYEPTSEGKILEALIDLFQV
jgi:hypothetical protein